MNFILGLIVYCNMNGFSGFPNNVKGEVVISLKNFITISVKNRTETETVEMTFPKKMCIGAKNAKPTSK